MKQLLELIEEALEGSDDNSHLEEARRLYEKDHIVPDHLLNGHKSDFEFSYTIHDSVPVQETRRFADIRDIIKAHPGLSLTVHVGKAGELDLDDEFSDSKQEGYFFDPEFKDTWKRVGVQRGSIVTLYAFSEDQYVLDNVVPYIERIIKARNYIDKPAVFDGADSFDINRAKSLSKLCESFDGRVLLFKGRERAIAKVPSNICSLNLKKGDELIVFYGPELGYEDEDINLYRRDKEVVTPFHNNVQRVLSAADLSSVVNQPTRSPYISIAQLFAEADKRKRE